MLVPSTSTRPAAGDIAVAVHDVEPSTFERVALIRDWLDDHGVDRVTLLVIPAHDLHPFNDRRPEMVDWLAERQAGGDAIAQHGFQHRQTRRAEWPRQTLAGFQGHGSAEFVGLDEAETRRAVLAGRRVLRLAGIEPRGFVAPAYAYTAALRSTIASTFDWWASLRALHRAADRDDVRSPALCLGTSSPLKRLTSPLLVRSGALMAGPLLRLDLHPADLDHPAHVGAVEAVLRRARKRRSVTYDMLA
jgi:predicted deacetylase